MRYYILYITEVGHRPPAVVQKALQDLRLIFACVGYSRSFGYTTGFWTSSMSSN